MTLHTDTWVVAGTAAPVIALSSMLVLSDQLQIKVDLDTSLGRIPFKKWPSRERGMFFSYFIVSVVTMFQAFVLAGALISLTYQINFVPILIVIIGEVLSLALLVNSTLDMVRQKIWANEQIDKHSVSLRSRMPRRPAHKAQANAFKRAIKSQSRHK